MRTSSVMNKPLAARSMRVSQHGFTLVEIMIATGLGAIVLLALMTSYSLTSRGFLSAGNYSDMERDARVSLDYLSQDARQATGLTAYAATDISLAVPTNFSSKGAVAGTKIVRYYRGTGSNTNNLYRVDNGTQSILAQNVSSLIFVPYDMNLSTSGVTASSCKLLQVDITLKKYTIDNANTEQILSARVALRNKILE